MSIATEIQRLQTAKGDIVRALDRIGYHVPSGATLDDFGAYIDPYTSGKTITWMDNPSNYLRFKFITEGSVKWQNVKGDIQYSKNGGSTWTYFNEATVNCNEGDEIWFKGALTGGCGYEINNESSKFNTVGKFYAAGNVQSLCNFSNTLVSYHFANLFFNCLGLNISVENMLIFPATTLSENCYQDMFYCCTSLTTAPALPATTLASACYQGMFSSCTSLTTAPALPATTLQTYCYNNMFYNCTSLTTAPALPGTTLANYCYNSMFYNCTSLTTAPALPATTLQTYCYNSMFYNCTSLTTAPALPATTLQTYCYSYMFYNCASLTTAPALPATTLANYCYSYMFYNCTSLTTAPALAATTLQTYCYESMFRGCTSLTTAPELPATTLAIYCYRSMFSGCTSLNYIKCMATNISAINSTNNWVAGVQTTSGTFVKSASMTSWTTGNNGIPSGWTVENAT